MSHRRDLARLQAMARQSFRPEQLLPLLVQAVGQRIAVPSPPAFLVLEPGFASMADFIVWEGLETHNDELRAALGAGVWPGPSSMPRLDETIRLRPNRRVHAATFYGEGATEDGPWTAMWRERRVCHALQAAVISPKGRAGFLMAARGPALAPFSPAEIAFVEEAVPVLASAMDDSGAPSGKDLVPDATASLFFAADGAITGMGPDGLDWLRDIGGGGPDAREAGRSLVEAISREASRQAAGAAPVCTTIGGDAGDRALRAQVFAFRHGPESAAVGFGHPVPVAENGFGRFELALRPIIGTSGAQAVRMGTLVRKVPRALVVLRGAGRVALAPRLIELAVALARGDTFEGASVRLGLTVSTVKTLARRLFETLGVSDRSGAMDRLLREGRSADPRLELDFRTSPAYA